MKNLQTTKGLIIGIVVGVLITGTGTFAAVTNPGMIGSLFDEVTSGVYKLIGTNITTDSITADQLGINSVGAGELANNSVDTASIINRTIRAEDIGTGLITSNELGTNSVGNSELENDVSINFVRGINSLFGDNGTIAQSTDEWLRLNPSGTHSLGIYTNGLLRADGGLNVGANEGFYRGGPNVIDTDDVLAVNNRLYVSTNPSVDHGVGNRSFNDGRYIQHGETNSVGSIELATDAVNSIKILDGSITASDIDTSAVQRRVASSCPAGQSIRVINANGTVTCEIDTDTDTNSWRLVVNNLSSTSTTSSLSAYQGRVLNNDKISKGDSGDHLADNTVDSSEIQDNSLTANDLGTNSVGNSELIDSPTFTSVWAYDFLYRSDKRLKKNIYGITSATEKVNLLEGVNFTWKENGEREVGFIAQDVEKILPELVVTDSDGMKSVKYGNITAVLVEALKEQSESIEILKKEISVLKKNNK